MASKVKCTCGHSWNKSDSSKKDVNVCHVCGKDNTMKNGGWLDNYGKADNANESNVSMSDDFVGLAYDTSGRNYSPSWGGQFQTGGSIPGSVGFTYARTGDIPSNGKYAKKTMASAQNGNVVNSEGIELPEFIVEASKYVKPKRFNMNKQNFSEEDETLINQYSDKISGLELQNNPDYQYRKYRESLPQLRQGLSREEEFKRDALRYADVTTDLMQVGNFYPHPVTQFIGKVGNVAGGMIDGWQSIQDISKGNYLSAGVNAASAFVPNYLGSKGKGYLRSIDNIKTNSIPDKISRLTEKGEFYRPLVYAKPSHVSNPVITRGLNFNRSVLGTNLMETGYDASDPKFQNGGEMKFYQEGLDWKPKSMQEGGEQVSYSDPRYAELYRNRQVGSWSPQNNAYNLPDLPEVTVTGKDERVQEAMSQGNQRFAQGVLGVLGSSQTVPMELFTGKQQTPSEAWGFQQPGGWLDNPSSFGKNLSNFGMDAILDPMSITDVAGIRSLGKGFTKKLAESSIPKPGLGRVLKKSFDSLNPSNLDSPSALDWTKQWYSDPEILKRKVYSAYGDPTDEFIKSHAEKTSKDFVEYANENLNQYQPKNYIDLLKDEGIGQYLKKSFTTGGLSYGVPDEIYVNRSMYYPFDRKGLEGVRAHELSHLVNYNGRNLNFPEENQLLKPFGFENSIDRFKRINKVQSKSKKKWADYYTEPTEIKARMDQARYHLGLTPSDEFTPEMFDKISKEKEWFGMGKYIKDKDAFIDLMNKFWAVPAVGVVGAQSLQENKYGGIIKDNRGQWDHPGEITEIDSPYITMQGVPYDVLGIDDTGDTKLMEPGKDYKFKGEKVTEYPLMQKGGRVGINDLDAQPKKKLNQLTNFTNNPDKNNWLDKYK